MTAGALLLDECPSEQLTGAERRVTVRYPIVQRCLVRPVDAKGFGTWQAIAYNISSTGIGLALAYPLREGTMLTIQPWGKRHVSPLQARVVHSSLVSFLLFHGCELMEPLSEKELAAWLS